VRRWSFRRERWFSEFKKLGKGKNKRPDGFTPYIRKLTRQLASEKPVDKSKRTEKMWSWEKNSISIKSYHQTLGISPTTLVLNLSLPFVLVFWNNKLRDKFNLGSI